MRYLAVWGGKKLVQCYPLGHDACSALRYRRRSRIPGPRAWHTRNERLPARIPGATAVVEARMWGMQEGRASGQAVRLRNRDVGDGWWRSVVALIYITCRRCHDTRPHDTSQSGAMPRWPWSTDALQLLKLCGTPVRFGLSRCYVWYSMDLSHTLPLMWFEGYMYN
jgi:hypothetical protein